MNSRDDVRNSQQHRTPLSICSSLEGVAVAAVDDSAFKASGVEGAAQRNAEVHIAAGDAALVLQIREQQGLLKEFTAGMILK